MPLVLIVSLPRSGSTLLQRALSAHPSVDSAPEPWLLLPLLSMMGNVEVYSEFGWDLAQEAISEFLRAERKGAFIEGLECLLARCYGLGPGRVFVDKTPRYSLILEEILEWLPSARIILLFRNPIDVVNSILQTWGREGKRWRIRPYFVDLYSGMRNMLAVAQRSCENVISIKYEELVREPNKCLGHLWEFIGIEPPEHIALNSLPRFNGTMGDKTGVAKYRHISTESIGKPRVFCNAWRRRWMANYIRTLETWGIEEVGYSVTQMREQLSISTGHRYYLRDAMEQALQIGKVILPLRRIKKRRSEKAIKRYWTECR